MTTQLTPEQIQQYLAQMQATQATPPPAPKQAASLPGLDGFEDTEVSSSGGRQMYQFPGRFEGLVSSLTVGNTKPDSPKGMRPLYIIEVEVTSSTHDGLPVGSRVSFVKTGGTGVQATYYHRGIKESIGALLGIPAGEVSRQNVVDAASEQQPHTGQPLGWEVFDYTSPKTGKTGPVVRFFHVAS